MSMDFLPATDICYCQLVTRNNVSVTAYSYATYYEFVSTITDALLYQSMRVIHEEMKRVHRQQLQGTLNGTFSFAVLVGT